jgi:hypothetical protein
MNSIGSQNRNRSCFNIFNLNSRSAFLLSSIIISTILLTLLFSFSFFLHFIYFLFRYNCFTYLLIIILLPLLISLSIFFLRALAFLIPHNIFLTLSLAIFISQNLSSIRLPVYHKSDYSLYIFMYTRINPGDLDFRPNHIYKISSYKVLRESKSPFFFVFKINTF